MIVRRVVRRGLLLCCACLPALGCGRAGDSRAYTVLREFPHDTGAYTQGLVYADGWLFESTGRYGLSDVRRVELATGRIDARRGLPEDRFGEGLALLEGRLYQLTWKSGVGYVYDAASLAPLDSFAYAGEGWGLTTDGALLIKSDGTAVLEFMDPESFHVVRRLTVEDRGAELSQLNELEFVNGDVFANVYLTDWIVRIDLTDGTVRQWIDMAGLLPLRDRSPTTDVLNGVAVLEETGDFLVTGKLWPTVFQIRLRGEETAQRGQSFTR